MIQHLNFGKAKTLDDYVDLSYNDLINIVQNSDYSPEEKLILIKKLRKTPSGAYIHFFENLDQHVKE